ncbi:MAG: M24 family metallopeptidase [Geminicoccales bacterium]
MRKRDDLVFSMAEFERRLQAVRKELDWRGLDALIVTTPENIFYLTGYQTPGYYYFQALVVPLAGEPFMVTRLLEQSNVEVRTWIEVSRPYADNESAIGALRHSLDELGLSGKRLGYEKHCYFFRATEQEQLFVATPETSFLDCSGLIEEMRLVKSDEEIAIMRRAAAAADAGMRAGIDAVHAGVTENDIAAEVHYAMIKAGSEYPAISPFVASGWRSAIGHATWEGRKVEPGDVVFLEVGGCVHRYHAALMRTVFLGQPETEVAEAERYLCDAMEATIAAIRPGIQAGDVDGIARSILAQHTFGGVQATRSGYSIGIAFAPDWGEGHILSLQPGVRRVLRENMTFHLIPWIQIPGRAGVGLTETVRVTHDGCERLSQLERTVFVK